MNELTEIECENFVEDLLLIMYDYTLHNIHLLSKEDYDDLFVKHIDEYVAFIVTSIQETIPRKSLEDLISYTINIFYEACLPPRSFDNTYILKTQTEEEINIITDKINYLRSIPQPEQRTNEWYIFRNNLITASNAYKIFDTDASQNQLIYEKCLAFNQKILVVPDDSENFKHVNVLSPLHWGQKYEHLSVMIYEDKYKTTIEEFGCIKHEKHSFLGASPDGINVDKNSGRYGRLIEIKNVVNREITGIPKVEYWIQMQLQMETCNLNECDFLETKFKEYETEEEYLEDECEYKGVIMYFSYKNGIPKYIYRPLHCLDETWEETMMTTYQDEGLIWIKNIYWKLEIISCVLVVRNNLWFEYVVYDIRNFWKIIEHERNNGFDHRKAKKRIRKIQEEESKCLITL
jgi:putative phage-type endonuclease